MEPLSPATPENPIHHPTTYSYIKGSRTSRPAPPPNPLTSKGNIHVIHPPDYDTSWDYHPLPFLTSIKLQINASLYIFLFNLSSCRDAPVCMYRKEKVIYRYIYLDSKEKGARILQWHHGTWDGSSHDLGAALKPREMANLWVLVLLSQQFKVSSLILYSHTPGRKK